MPAGLNGGLPGLVRPTKPEMVSLGWQGLGDSKSLAAGVLDAISAENRSVDANPKSLKSFRSFGTLSFRGFNDTTDLKLFATDPNQDVKAFREASGLKKIVALVKTNAADKIVLERGCLLIAALSREGKDFECELVSHGAVVLVVDILKKTLGFPEVAVASLLALQSVTSDEASRKEVVAKGGVEAVIAIMGDEGSSARIAALGCTVLSNSVFGSDASRAHVGNAGAMRVVTKVMMNFEDDSVVQQRGALALRNIGYQCSSNHDLAADQGVIPALVTAIQNFLRTPEIVHQASVALANFTSTNQRNRILLEENRCIPLVLRVFSELGESGSSTEDGLTLLRNLTAQNESAVREIGLQKGVGPTVSAISRHRDRGPVIEKGVAALRYICFSQENRYAFAAEGGIELLAHILKQPLMGQLAEHAILALGNGVFRNPESQKIAAHLGTISSLVTIGRLNEGKPVILEAVTRVLRCLVDDCHENFQSALDSEVIPLVVDIMAENPSSEGAQEQSLALLFILADSEECRRVIHSSAAETYVQRAVSAHAKHRGIQLHSMLLLARLHGASVHLPPPPQVPLVAKHLPTDVTTVSASGYTAVTTAAPDRLSK